MENSTAVISGLAGVILGLVVGYFIGFSAAPGADWMHDDAAGGHGHMHEGMMGGGMHDHDIIRQDGAMQHAMDEMMVGFRGKEGAEYEEAFLRGMIVHHIGAVEMTEDLLEETDRPELVEFGNDIITQQSAEIE